MVEKIQVVPKDSWAISERIHWVNFSEEGSLQKQSQGQLQFVKHQATVDV
jgi:hypothetical protein